MQSESVNGANAGRKSLPKEKAADDVSFEAKSLEDKAAEALSDVSFDDRSLEDKAAEAPSDKAAEAPKDVSVDGRSSKDKAPAKVSEGSLVLLDKQVSNVPSTTMTLL